MATSLTLQNDPSSPQGYLKVNGTTAATITTSGLSMSTLNSINVDDYTVLSDFIGANQDLVGSSGYQKLPGGLIIQWVNANHTNGVISTTLPIAFPNAFLGAVITEGNAIGWINGGSVFTTIYGESGSTTTTLNGRCTQVFNGGGFDNTGIANFNAIVIGY